MLNKEDEKIIRKLENQNYKGTKSLVLELDEHLKEHESQQDFIDELYRSLSDYGIQKLDKVIERYNNEHPENNPLKTYSQVIEQYQKTIDESANLFLNYGSKYGNEHFTDEFIKNQFMESMTSVSAQDAQAVIDEINKKVNSIMKSQGFSAIDEAKTNESFEDIVHGYGEQNMIRTRISNFAHAEAQVERLMKGMEITDQEKSGMTEDEIASKKSHLIHDFKYNLLKMEKSEKPDDFQAIVDMLDRRIGFDERKALDSAIRFNNKENQNKYETRRIKLTELEKDRSWQQFRSDSIFDKKYREFKNILDELKKNKEKPHDKYDRGFINGSLRMLTNLQNLVTEVANFVNGAIDYFLPKEQKDENNKSEKHEKEVSKKISPFYKIMEEAYWEKGFVESFSYEAGMITPEQAEKLFTTDIAYIKSLDKEQQEKMFGVYADGLMTAMKDERISANTKALYQTFIAKYENGEYDKQISDIIDEGVDWTGIYSDKNEGLLRVEDIVAPKASMKSGKESSFSGELPIHAGNESSFAGELSKQSGFSSKSQIQMGKCIEDAVKLGRNIAYSNEKSTDIVMKNLSTGLDNLQEKYPDMTKEQFDLCKQIAATSIVSNSKYTKPLIDAMSSFNSKGFYIASAQSRIQIILKGAELITRSRQLEKVSIDDKANACQECLRKELKSTMKRLTKPDTQKLLIKNLAQNITSNRQQYTLAVELKALGLRFESEKTLSTDIQIGRKASALLGRYSESLDKKTSALSSYERLTTLLQMTVSTSEVQGEQRFLDVLKDQLKDITPPDRQEKILNLINEDIEKYNKLCQKCKMPELQKIPGCSEEKSKAVLLNGLNEAALKEQEGDQRITVDDIIKAFNENDKPNAKFDEWVQHADMDEIQDDITIIDKNLDSQTACVDFYSTLIRYNLQSNAPNCEKAANDYLKKINEQEL